MKNSAVLLVSILFVAATAFAQDYAIKLNQPLKVGQRYRFKVTAGESEHREMTSKEAAPKSQTNELNLEMESEVTVLKVDSKGQPTKEEHTIVKLIDLDSKQSILPVRTKVLVTRSNWEKIFKVDGKPAASEIAKVLDLAVDVSSGKTTDDEFFGITEPKKVGDSWNLNQKVALKVVSERFRAQGMKVESIQGTMTLQNVTQEKSVEVLHLTGRTRIKAVAAPKGPFTSLETLVDATFATDLPSDIFKKAAQTTCTTTVTINGSGKPGGKGPLAHVSGIRKRTYLFTFEMLQ